MPEELGPLLSRYEVRGELGRGATGVVHRVAERSSERVVALKALFASSAEQRARLKEEFRLLRDLGHPHVVQVFELFVDDGHCAFTMELIEGRSFVDACEGQAARVERLGAQLLEAIAAVHSVGLQHRDVKPANALVTHEDRVVLVDFDLARKTRGRQDAELAGTIDYMAPEVMWGKSQPRSDWYSAGLCLYQALCGELPFEEGAAGLTARGSATPTIPADVECAPWLRTLVDRMLQPDPNARPGHEEVLRCLADARRLTSAAPPPDVAGRSEIGFVGRTDELELLLASAPAAGRLVLVQGPPGTGKSELVRQAGRRLAEDGAWVLEGQCSPAERVPHNAMDRAMDRLAAMLDPSKPTAAMVEASRLFPALSESPPPSLPDPVEAGRRATEALAELFAESCRERRVVMVVDEAQWADASSRTLLTALSGHATGLELWVVQRSDEPLVELTLPADSSVEQVTLELEPLSDDAIAAIAKDILGAEVEPDTVARIVEQAAGSPLLASALARHGAYQRVLRSPSDRLAAMQELVQGRIAHLEPVERDMVGVVAVAQRPVETAVLERALGKGSSEAWVHALERYGLVRRGPGTASQVAMAHPRIGDAVVQAIDDGTRRDIHGGLAAAYEHDAETVEPAVVFHHYDQAQRRPEARRWALAAASRADRSLAFETAAEFYGRAIELEPDADDVVQLWDSKARAWVDAGRGERAADAFQQAARRASTPARREDLLLSAAEHLVRSGRADEGAPLLDGALQRVGAKASMSPRWALIVGMVWRVWFLLRGGRFFQKKLPAAQQPAPPRLEILWRASHCLAMTDFTVAHALGGRFLYGALREGDGWQVARALGNEATFESALGGKFFTRRSDALMEAMHDRVASIDDPFPRAMAHGYQGVCDWNRGRWRASIDNNLRCVDALLDGVPGKFWEIAIGRVHAFTAMAYCGEFARLAELVPEALEDALRRGDLFAANFYRLGDTTLYRLAQGGEDEARDASAAAEGSWPNAPYHLHRYHHFNSSVQIALYRGDVEEAWRQVDTQWQVMKDGQFLVHETAGTLLWHLRARVVLARQGFDRSMGREVERMANRVERASIGPGRGLAATLRAGMAARVGDEERASTLLGEAMELLDEAGMAAIREACRWQRGRLRGDDGDSETAGQWLEEHGVRSTGRMAALLVPGFGVS
ncbi:MAG: AAA family ATPase [Myxococcota bacterium]